MLAEVDEDMVYAFFTKSRVRYDFVLEPTLDSKLRTFTLRSITDPNNNQIQLMGPLDGDTFPIAQTATWDFATRPTGPCEPLRWCRHAARADR